MNKAAVRVFVALTPSAILCAAFAHGEDRTVEPATHFCDYNETLRTSMVKRGYTPLSLSPKYPKPTISKWRRARVRGLQPVVTTFFSVHSREALPVLRTARPPKEAFNHFFRCRGFGKELPLDGRLVDAVLEAAVYFRSERVEVISAYRSRKFNDTLAKKGRNVSSDSKHTRGEAIDFRLTTTDATTLGLWLWERFEGGVGTYVKDGFIHLDVGRKRRWRGK